MRLLEISICGLMLLIGTVAFGRGPLGFAKDDARQELVNLENRWLQSEDDPDALVSILADDFLHVIPAGIITKNEQLTHMRHHPPNENPFYRRLCVAE
jgi:hypothetical protein